MAYTTIDDPSAYFQTALYNGSASSVTVTNDGNSDLQPDWLWFKKRSATSDHNTFDTSRGLTERLFPNSTSQSDSGDNGITSLTNGFTTGTFYGDVNGSGQTFVTWQWKANGGSRTTFTESGANPGGGYQANTTAGFSIVDYTGTGTNGGTVAHGLGATPTIAIIKDRDTNGTNWIVVYTIQDGSSDRLYLQGTNTKFDLSGTEFRADFDSSNITLGTWNDINADGKKFIAYVFTPIKGYSRFGMYRGNSSSDGTFVYTGFKPAWLMFKRTDATASWGIVDNRRNKNDTQNIGNVIDAYLNPDLDNDDSGNSATTDFLSNGFKHRRSGNFINNSGATYIYMAFAEHPFTTSDSVPTTAR